jgi:tetratricopeptide (TPR) repeat protein
VRSNQDDYFVVIGSATSSVMDDVRHGYLHLQLDSLIAANLAKVQDRSRLLSLIADREGVSPEYSKDFYFMMTESLIRAVELRIDRIPAGRAQESLKSYYRSGLLLAPYFYEALQSYEQQQSDFRSAFGKIAEAITFKGEQDRFDQTFLSIPVPQKQVRRAEVPPPLPTLPANPLRDLLRQAQIAFNNGDNERSRASFSRVISEMDATNGSALYGLGLIASREDNSKQAKDYFDRTVKSESAEPDVKVWAYIYLGRIADLDCERARALDYYRQAIEVGDNTRNAQGIARDGINKPWGDVCR